MLKIRRGEERRGGLYADDLQYSHLTSIPSGMGMREGGEEVMDPAFAYGLLGC